MGDKGQVFGEVPELFECGFDPGRPERTWYTAAPVPGVRLITLNTSDPAAPEPERVYSEGAVSLAQLFFLAGELKSAEERGEIVIVATHHPSATFAATYGSALMPNTFRQILRRSSNVKLHIAGHSHRNAVTDRGGYVEVETCSILDAPQEGRVIEIWQVLAWSSFVISLAWGIWRSKKGLSAEPYLLPWTCHLSWIMLSFFWNAVGALVPLVSVAYVIK